MVGQGVTEIAEEGGDESLVVAPTALVETGTEGSGGRCDVQRKRSPLLFGSKFCGSHQVITAMIRVLHESTEVFQITIGAQALACVLKRVGNDVLSNQILFIERVFRIQQTTLFVCTSVHQPSVFRYSGAFEVTYTHSIRR